MQLNNVARTLSTFRKRFLCFGGSNTDFNLPNSERNLVGNAGSFRSPSQITTAFNVPSLSSAILCAHFSNELEMIIDFFCCYTANPRRSRCTPCAVYDAVYNELYPYFTLRILFLSNVSYARRFRFTSIKFTLHLNLWQNFK